MNKNYTGVIIEESLENKEILKKVKILETKVEPVTEKHQTPWLKQWTLYTIEIPEDKIDDIAEEISRTLDSKNAWYADFKNEDFHFIIFRDKVFKVNRTSKKQYEVATKYGISLGIPDYQVNFAPDVKERER